MLRRRIYTLTGASGATQPTCRWTISRIINIIVITAQSQLYRPYMKTNSSVNCYVYAHIQKLRRSECLRNETRGVVLTKFMMSRATHPACARRKLSLIELCAPSAVALFNIQSCAENYLKQPRSPSFSSQFNIMLSNIVISVSSIALLTINFKDMVDLFHPL